MYLCRRNLLHELKDWNGYGLHKVLQERRLGSCRQILRHASEQAQGTFCVGQEIRHQRWTQGGEGRVPFICQYIRDVFTGKYREYNVLNLTVIVGALVYVLTPVDALPDWIPMAGLIDDAAILMWATHEFADELDRYRFFLGRRQREDDKRAAEEKALEIEDIDFEEIPPFQIGS